MITAIIFLIVLAILVFVHELGHFLAAKKFGIRVDEFGLGFPPKIYGKKFGETEYTLNWIPFGGFVKIFGENPDAESLEGPDAKRSLIAKPRWQQAIVLIAGISFNFIFAWLLISAAFMFGVAGSKDSYAALYPTHFTDERVAVSLVEPASPAEKADIKVGDSIIGVASGVSGQTIADKNLSIETFRTAVNASAGLPLKITLRRDNETITRDVVAVKGIADTQGRYAIGIGMEEVGTLRLPVYLAVYEGGRFALVLIERTATGFFNLIVGAFHGTSHLSSLKGPVGIAGFVGDAARSGFASLCMIAALISVNLAVLNLIPFPALDGGRILFVLIEAIIRRPIAPKVANMVNTVGFALLLLLMFVITIKDVWNIWK